MRRLTTDVFPVTWPLLLKHIQFADYFQYTLLVSISDKHNIA